MAQTAAKPRIEDEPIPASAEFSDVTQSIDERLLIRLRLLWSSRRVLAKASAIGLAVGCAAAFLIPARYESSVQLMPPDNQSGSGLAMLAALSSKSGNAIGGLAGDFLGIKSSGALFIGILGSRTVQDRLIDRFNLKKVYSTKLQGDARRKLADNTGLSEDRKSGIIDISVTDRDPKRAAAVTQAYVDELNSLVAELSTSAAHRERVFLEERLRSVKHDLDDASQRFSQFASKNNAIDIKEQSRAIVDAAARLQGELIATESQLKGLEEIYTPDNYRVRATQARVSELQRQLEKLSGQEITNGSPVRSLYPSIRELPVLGVTYADLYRQTRIEEAVYETLTQQYELAKVQEAKEIPSVKVLTSAQVPERKSFPPRFLITILGAAIFLGAATSGLLLRAHWQEMHVEDPGRLFAQEVLSELNKNMPWVTPNGSRWQAASHRIWVRLTGSHGSDTAHFG